MTPKTLLYLIKVLLGLTEHLNPKQRLPALVVEDDRTEALMIAEYLERVGVEARIVHTVADARSEMDRQPFRMVFLDLHFPGEDGIGFWRELKIRRPQLPVVGITGFPESVCELPSGRKWSVIFKGSSGGSLLEAIQDAIAESNGINGYVTPRQVVGTTLAIGVVMFCLGFFAREIARMLP